MSPDDQAAPVTRREFNQALVLVWTFILLALSTTVFSSRSSGPTVSHVIYLMTALGMVINYAVASWRGDVSLTRVVVAALLALLAFVVGAVAFFAGRI
jgi:hypothetical protein